MVDDCYPLVSVVIPVHNGWPYTSQCLMALAQSTYPNLQVTVVDDGSTDETAQALIQHFSWVRALTGDGNLWWAGAMNLGIEDALARGAAYVMSLNNDVLVSADTVSALVECAEARGTPIVGSLIYEASRPGVIWCAGGALRWPWPGETMVGNGEPDLGQFIGVRQVSWTPGMGTLMRRDVLLELRLYDAARMPQYLADADFGLRAAHAGHSILVTSHSKIYNHTKNTGGLSTTQTKFKVREFISIFTDLRSPDYLPARLTFLWRHCPKRWLLPAVVTRYLRILGYGLKRLAP